MRQIKRQPLQRCWAGIYNAHLKANLGAETHILWPILIDIQDRISYAHSNKKEVLIKVKNTLQCKATNERNLGIDFLRMLAMFMVSTLHILGQGGILANAGVLSVNYEIAWFLEIAAYCAVNCFALISGYVYGNSKFKYSRIVSLWLQVTFYTVIITAIFAIFVPGSVGIKEWIKAFFPTLFSQYWYFTAYFGMFFFIPFLNHLLNSLKKRDLQILLFSIIVVFSILPTLRRADVFNTGLGYSTLWLTALYLIGGYIKKYSVENRVQAKWFILLYFVCIVLTWLSKLTIEFVTAYYLGTVKYGYLLVWYTSPTILFAGIALLFFFSKCTFNNELLSKSIKILAPVSFSVYLIQTQNLVWEYIMRERFVSYCQYSAIKMAVYILITAFSSYILCSLIDLVRVKIFKFLNINRFSELVVQILKSPIIYILNRGIMTNGASFGAGK